MNFRKLVSVGRTALGFSLFAPAALAATVTVTGAVMPPKIGPGYPLAWQFQIQGDPSNLTYCVSTQDVQTYPIAKSDLSNGLIQVTVTAVSTLAEITPASHVAGEAIHPGDCGITSSGNLSGFFFVITAQ